jgi:outer membrane protein assembly factor BamB
VTYDGGVLVLDGETLETIDQVELGGFLRANGAGDHDGHVFITAEDGFHVLDTGLASDSIELTGEVFAAAAAGHVTPHAGRTALFDDGTGEIRVFDTDAIGTGMLPEFDTLTSDAAHHGVAIELSDGTTLATVGTAEARSGVRHLAADGSELARNEECPSVHGEGALKGEIVMFGCEDGVLLFADGAFTKLDAPDEFGRTGNAYVTDTSAIAFGDYKTDPDAEGYLLSQLVRIDTETQELSVIDLPEGAEYTWRGVGRDAHDNVVVLGADGRLYLLDEDGEVVDQWSVIEPWESPAEWQQPHPGLRVVGDIAYVTEPATDRILAIDLHSGEVAASAVLDVVPNEFVVVGAAGH